MWPVGQAVKTPASHAGNAGSIPARVTTRQGPGAATRPRLPYRHPYHARPKRHLAPRYLAARLDISPARGTEPVFITVRSHPFPSRTRKLSSPVPKILGGKLPGKIGLRRHLIAVPFQGAAIPYSSLAQSVEHAAVNRRVVCSSQTGGATKAWSNRSGLFLYKGR